MNCFLAEPDSDATLFFGLFKSLSNYCSKTGRNLPFGGCFVTDIGCRLRQIGNIDCCDDGGRAFKGQLARDEMKQRDSQGPDVSLKRCSRRVYEDFR